MSEQYTKKLDAIILSWMELRNGVPMFQKRTYKDVQKAEEYFTKLLSERDVTNPQSKECYRWIKTEKQSENVD